DRDAVLTAQRDDQLAIVDQLARDLFDPRDHRLRAAGMYGKLGQRVDTMLVWLAFEREIEQLHIGGGVNDRGWSLTRARPRRRGRVVRYRQYGNPRSGIAAVFGVEPAEVALRKEAVV